MQPWRRLEQLALQFDDTQVSERFLDQNDVEVRSEMRHLREENH